MAQAAQKLDEAANVTRGLRTRLQSHKAQLMHNWQGISAAAFNRVFDQFDEDFSKVLTTMEGMHEKLVQTRIKYQSTEEEQQQAVNRVAGLLNN